MIVSEEVSAEKRNDSENEFNVSFFSFTLQKWGTFEEGLRLSMASIEAKYPLDISFASLSKDIH